ncbi:unnamed protein product, partial [Ceratitis capitata]
MSYLDIAEICTNWPRGEIKACATDKNHVITGYSSKAPPQLRSPARRMGIHAADVPTLLYACCSTLFR